MTPEGVDAWRAGPLDADDIAALRAIAAALPAEGYATPLAGRRPLHLPEPEALVRAFADAVADWLPRTPAAPLAAGRPFAAAAPQRVPELRDWAAQVASGADAGVGISLRLDLSALRLFDEAEPEDTRRAGAAVVQVHSLSDPTLVTDAGALWAGTAGAGFGPRARIDAVLALRRAARVWPPLLRLLEQPVPDVLALSDPELSDLLGAAATRLAAAGVVVHWPRELARTLTATAVVRPTAPGSAADGTSFFDATTLFAFSWELALGGDRLTPGEMEQLAQAHRPVVRLRDQWVRVDPELVRKARKRELGLLDPVDALSVALGGTAEVDGETVPAVPVGALAALRDRLTEELTPLPAPPGLRATLRDYQARGLAWLDRMTSLGLGGCLADDMGLGKTLTLIALHLHRARPEPTLVVCPASLLGNWQREIEKFAPGVPVHRFHGSDRTLPPSPPSGLDRDRDTDTEADARTGRVPDALGVRDAAGTQDAEAGASAGASASVGDGDGSGPAVTGAGAGAGAEGGSSSARAVADGAGSSPAGAGFVLTTYATMRASAAVLAGRRWGMVVADEAQHVKNPRSATAKALRTIPAPARVALTGTPVENNLSELWALLDWTTPGLLGPLTTFRARHARAVEQQHQVEDGCDEEAVARLAALVRPFLLRRKKSDPGIVPELPPKTETDHPVALTREQASLYQAAVDEAMAVIGTSEGMARRGMIMKLLASLKQICNHPAQYLKEDPPRIAHRSGKLALLDELLDTVLAEGGSVLVFTQYVTMARILEGHLTARGIPSQLLHGGTPVARREELVDRFQSGEVPVFLLSLKAAGTGLNLTRAGHVIHFDRWWNPAVEEQATDRAYRIGQTQPVQVHRIIAEGTVEDRIAELLETKRALADAVLGSGEAALTELTDRELADLVSLRRPA
ncbi:DEAD/DEAH box helicase [Streptomyces sp. SMC 277]|uniref:DEAD/DEAH box helicase n=1 Tax=Streptomyces antimicrobicus TaxID=2883108 RepID=A0ABS8BER9_9ACTN|nr:DEAD/DEAH box helicase [Streptomyces antimicrobicus]MCB5183140.1 DEAD/DEAH box helicase [Streptomyces antimicrobicus]